MDSPQSIVSPLKTSAKSEKRNGNLFAENPIRPSREINFQGKGNPMDTSDEFVGALNIYVHQARDIHNICIYQKQDVYAKLCLTSDPENTVSTKINMGGGRNPVFNENLRLDVRKVDSSLKCEIWMLSRVKNYLEDQLLGFALVPVSEVLIHNGKLEKEFPLSSTDLFHSPAGFVQLSVSYIGTQPDVIPIPAPQTCAEADSAQETTKSLPGDLNKIEFPDPTFENYEMVEEYFGISCSNLESHSSDSLVSSDTENQVSSKARVQHGDSFSTEIKNSDPTLKIDSPPSSVSTNEASSTSVPVSSESSQAPKETKSPNGEHVSPPKEALKDKTVNGVGAESKESVQTSNDANLKPLVNVNIEPESKVVQQDIVDMYMKSMQQFTESLAKMKLPMDFESGPPSDNSSTDQKSPASSKNSGSRVFYGSRAFF